jgi:hypothetical protein
MQQKQTITTLKKSESARITIFDFPFNISFWYPKINMKKMNLREKEKKLFQYSLINFFHSKGVTMLRI